MRFLKIFGRKKDEKKRLTDFYQHSVEKFGRSQIKKLADKGISIPVILL